ncbi:MAG: pitrilysin family protein [Microscillaceae bacterium]|nr:pitrilysin family protein [Microscillaceae bacterium]
MMTKKLMILVLIFTWISAGAQTKLLEKIVKKGDEIVIPYEKYQLSNGLILIIHEDHSDPLIHVDVTYHVGSAREELKKSGFAHFFEHMMFQGSENVADEEHFKIITESGGTLNGSTNRDRTNYFETIPSNQLETILWLEADRMGFLLDAVTQKKFEVQRATVKNEKQQNYDNRPYGLYTELNARTLYPYGHPYSWLTIGLLEDLDRVNVEDLKKFFLRWYGPNNAVLTIGGDVNPKEVVRMAEKYFGAIPRGPEVKDLKLASVRLDHDRYVSYVDKNIRFPGLSITFPTVPLYHPDEAALDCLAEILGQGRSSYFYKKFVETKKANQANVSHRTTELAGEFTQFLLPFPGVSLADFEKEMREALLEFEKTGVKNEDIQKFIAGFEAGTINGLSSVRGKVSRLAAYETFAGNPNQIQEDIKRYTSVSKEDVMRVYNQYIKGKPSVIVSILPEGMEKMAAKEDNFKPQNEGQNPFPITDYSGLSYTRPKDNFDRSKRPTPGQAPLVNVPEFWTSKMDNGLKVIGTNSPEIPTVTLQITLEGGQQLDAKDLRKVGLANITASMMNESTENYSAGAISDELDKLGSSINVFGGRNTTTINIQSLKKNLDATLKLAEEKMFRPKFTQEDFDKVKKQLSEAAKAQLKQPVPIANNVYNKLLYGENHIMSYPVEGKESTLKEISLEDVKAFYKEYFSPSKAQLVVVGDISEKEILPKLGFLKNWKGNNYEIPKMPEKPSIDKTKIYLVDKQKAPQSEIRIGYLTNMPYDVEGEYFKSTLMNYPLGGAFNSRINLNLREDKGYTYGARSSFNSTKDPGPFTANAGVKGNVTDSAVVEFMKEITNYFKDGITNEELGFMKNSIGQRDALEYETPLQKANFLNRIVTYGLDKDFVKRQTDILNKITRQEINDLAKKHLNPEKINILVVGDKASIEPGLKKIGYEVILLDEQGNPSKEKSTGAAEEGNDKK